MPATRVRAPASFCSRIPMMCRMRPYGGMVSGGSIQNSQLQAGSAILEAISPMKDLPAIALHSQYPLGKHPLAGKAMTGAQMIVQVLADEGVEAIFGYSGGAILPTYDAIFTFNEAQKSSGARQMPLIVPA